MVDEVTLPPLLRDLADLCHEQPLSPEQIAEGQAALAELRERMEVWVEGLNEAQVRAVEEGFERLDEALEHFDWGLGQLMQAPQERAAIAEELSTAYLELLRLVVWFRDSSLGALGPTPIPTLNKFLWLKNHHLEALSEAVHIERVWMLERLDFLEAHGATIEATQLKTQVEEHLRCLNRLFQALGQSNLSQVDSEMKTVSATFEKLGEADRSFQQSTIRSGPTPSVLTNLIVSMARDYALNGIGREPLYGRLEELAGTLSPWPDNLRQLMEEQESPTTKKELDNLLTTMTGLSQTLDQLMEAVSEDDPDRIAGPTRELVHRTKELHRRYDSLSKRLGEKEKITCLQCGLGNDPGRATCAGCGARLPKFFVDQPQTSILQESAAAESRPRNLIRLENAVNRHKRGELDMAALEGELVWFNDLLEKQKARAETMQVPEEVSNGLALFEQAIDHFAHYLETHNTRLLDDGLQLATEGAEELMKASGGGDASVEV